MKNTTLSRNVGAWNRNTQHRTLRYVFKPFNPKPEVSINSVTEVCLIINKTPIQEGIETRSWGLKRQSKLPQETHTLTVTFLTSIQYVQCLEPKVHYYTFQTTLTATNLKKTPYILNKTTRCPTEACDSPPTYSVLLLNTGSMEVKTH
jgi:hypothetical protein